MCRKVYFCQDTRSNQDLLVTNVIDAELTLDDALEEYEPRR
jgi:hypothetical protein